MINSENSLEIIVMNIANISYAMFVIISSVVTILVGLMVFYTGWKWLFMGIGGVGTTSRFSSGMHKIWPAGAARFDHLTYKPYKGYNRLRSRKWNMDHMPSGM